MGTFYVKPDLGKMFFYYVPEDNAIMLMSEPGKGGVRYFSNGDVSFSCIFNVNVE